VSGAGVLGVEVASAEAVGMTAIPDGYYAVPDPLDPAVMTYWRQRATMPSGRPAVRAFNPWPDKARYGPVLYRRDVPTETSRRREVLEAHWERVRDYHRRVRESIEADPAAAGRRFAEWCIRCCCCGRALTEEQSKVLGIGPECRRGSDPGALAELRVPKGGRLHLEHLAKHGGAA
jgi:hypothetical protein